MSVTDLYPAVLGPSWNALARSVQRLHASRAAGREGEGRAEGVFSVRRGARLGARLIARLLGMPAAADSVAISLRVERTARGERWIRTFGRHPLSTAQWQSGGLLVEAMGLTQCWFRLAAVEGALVFEQVKARFGLRRFSMPLPRWLAPHVSGRASPRLVPGDDGAVHVSVRIGVPIFGLLVAYEGTVTMEDTP